MLLALSVFGAAPALAQQYTLTKIPVPDLSSFPPSADVSGAYVVGHGLNNGGEVVGNVGGVVGNAPTQPFVYNQGSSQLLPYLAKPEDWATASAINLNGIVVGESENTFVQGNAVSWQNGSISFLGSLYYIHGVGSPPLQVIAAQLRSTRKETLSDPLWARRGAPLVPTHTQRFTPAEW
jgi:probable HAF family extracellular repeat protein